MEKEKIFGFLLQQRKSASAPTCFIFYYPVKELINWAGIKRAEEFKDGTQRLLRRARQKAITRFIGSDDNNIIPNNILLAFRKGLTKFTKLEDQPDIKQALSSISGNKVSIGFLEFDYDSDSPDHEKPAFIVDGQHRIYGLADYVDENLPILVVALLDASIEEQAFQFIVINNKSVRVRTDNVKSIMADVDEKKLIDRLMNAGVRYGDTPLLLREINDREDSPFYGLLNWPQNRIGSKLVPVNAIEQSLNYLEKTFSFIEDDDDSMLALFFALWNGVRETYPDLWGNDNKLMKKVCINAINEYLVELVKMSWSFLQTVNIYDPESVKDQSKLFINHIPKEFWTEGWSIDRIQDNANVRSLIKEDIKKISENYRIGNEWHNDLVLVIKTEDD